MRKQVRGYFRKSLCGILSAAMIATSLIVPNMTVYAAPQDDEVSMTTENGEDKLVDESTGVKEEGEDKDKDSGSENPSGSVDGNNENADDKNSEKGGESGDSSEDENDSGEESGDIADEEDTENLNGDLTDGEGDDIDEELKSEEEEVEPQKVPKAVKAAADGTDDGYGKLVNGTFEDAELITENGYSYYGTPSGWKLEKGLWPKKESGNVNDSIYLHYYNDTGAEVETFAVQEIENLKPGVYTMSVQAGGTYEDGTFTMQVTGGDDLSVSQSLGKGEAWGTWETYTTKAFEVTKSNNSSIEVRISGKLAADKQIHLDNVELELVETGGENYGKLQNGDFELGETVELDEVDENGKKKTAWRPKDWIGSGDDYKLHSNSSATNNKTNFAHWWSQSGGRISISQKIENVKPGFYTVSLQVDQPYSADETDPISVEVRSANDTEKYLKKQSLGAGPAWNTWKPIKTDRFEIADPGEDSQVDIEIEISGTLGAGETFELDNVTLEPADNETSGGNEKTFYYYLDNTSADDEVGLYFWNNDGVDKISSTAKKADWSVENAGDTYLMSAVGGYTGWYSIPITVTVADKTAGFEIFTKAKDEEKPTTTGYKCSAWAYETVWAKLASGTEKAYAFKSKKCYEGEDMVKSILRNVTLYMYSEGVIPALQLGNDSAATKLTKIDETTGAISDISASGKDSYSNDVWNMVEVPDTKNWYQISFVAPGEMKFDDAKICGLYNYDLEKKEYSYKTSFINGGGISWGVDLTPVFAGKTYYKDGTFYKTLEEADPAALLTPLEKLQKLVKEAREYKKEDYKEKGWKEFTVALAAAEAVIKAVDEAESDENETKKAPTDDEIQTAYDDLKKAMDDLIPASTVETDINVKKVALEDDFITGADLSSYISLKESGTVFKDEKGNPLSDAEFFRYLKDGGTNWVRIRIWNDPYDGSGRGYGGGNNDLEKAKTMGKLATDAGMKVLIDFHYSDFWADPGKQQAPKAWKAMSLAEKEAAVESYTLSSLNALKDAGVAVGMVQVGNETNSAICGVTSRADMAKIFNAGSRAVRAFDKNCLVAIHFTNPEKAGFQVGWAADLKKYEVDYDVFATSYYPFWHGTTGDLESVLTAIALDYSKKVMVAETSWTTTWDDGDGHENTAPKTSQDLNYDISLQGQANEIRDVVNAVNEVNENNRGKTNADGDLPGEAIGVFYWEPAWISPYYVYDEDGKTDENLVKQNKEAWEKYGSGWASKYASEYDPDDAGQWYGGSAVDNQSWFDFDGTALPTAKVYSLIRTGAMAERAISSIGFAKDENPLEVPLGEKVEYPKAVATYNDGTVERLDVQWDQEEQEAVNTDKVGEYIVHGTVAEGGREYKLTLTIKVMRTSSANILQDPGFEKGIAHPDWDLSGATSCVSSKDSDWIENPRNGTYAMNFWSKDPAEFSVSQTVKPESGSYTFGGYIQGDGAGTEDVQYAFVEVSGEDGKLKFRRQAAFTLNGWRNWVNPEITGVEVETGDSVKVGVTIKATETGTSGVWGSLDDFYLYGTHSVSIADNIEHGSVETSVVKATGGEKVIVTVTPGEGYYLDTMTLSGKSITAENCANILTSMNGTVAFRAASGENTTNAAVLTYAAETAEAKSDAFTMPNGNVIVGATFKSIFGDSTEKIDLNAKDEAGNYLVQVNAGESNSPAGENPVPAQFHTGKNVTPAVELSYKGYKLTTADYAVAYANNKSITTPESKAKITLTAKGDKFTGTREILFEIKEDTRKEFSAKKLKVVFEASDKNGRTDKAAQAVYYLGKEKEVKPKISLYNITDDITDESKKAIDSTLYTVYYQDNKKIGKATLVVLPTDTVLNDPNGYKEGSITANFTIAKCPVNQEKVEVTVSSAPNYYTGKKVEPSVTVKYSYLDQGGKPKTVTLAKGTDYTVTCTNNVNASVYKTVDENGTVKYEPINANKVPTIKITGKGNFAGVRTTSDLQPNGKAGTTKLTFQIRPRELSNTTVTAADLAESTKAQAPKITVKDGTKAVAASQYEITEIQRTHDADGTALTTDKVETIYSKADGTGTAKVTAAGTYKVKIAGKSKVNYAGERSVSFRMVDKDYLISNAKITVSGKFYYTGSQVKLITTGDTPNLKVSCGKAAQLTEQSSASSSQDGYYVRYTNNTNAGKATITITGTGKYVGTKTAVFTINKRILTDKITKDSDKGLKGILQPVKMSKKTIETKQDGVWTPSSENSGLLINSDNKTKTEYGSLAIPYTGYTLSPEFKFSSENYDAVQKAVTNELSSSDYTVTYAIGKWTNDGKAPVTATIKGKGNYSGSVKIPNLFTVTARNLKNLRIDVSPVTYNGKALKPAVTFRDDKGKVVDLKFNTAYSISYKDNKDIMGVSKKQPTLTVKVKGKGWITDNADPDTKSRTLNFTIDQAEITKANIEDVKFQSFLGKALKPKVTVKVNGRKLKEGKDYTLIYSKNVKRGGTATVKITGKGNYFTRKPIEKTFVIK